MRAKVGRLTSWDVRLRDVLALLWRTCARTQSTHAPTLRARDMCACETRVRMPGSTESSKSLSVQSLIARLPPGCRRKRPGGMARRQTPPSTAS
eukprot:10419408-Alexandrium_andersonii.AAC.1